MSSSPQQPPTQPINPSTSSNSASTQADGTNTDRRDREWRFDLDFRLNPNWLSNPDAGGVPLPLSMLNDWIRNIQRPLSSESPSPRSSSSSTSNSPGSIAAMPPTDSPLVNDVSMTIGNEQTRQVPLLNANILPQPQPPRVIRIARRLQSAGNLSPGNDHETTEYPPPPPPPSSSGSSSGRSTGSVVIDVADNVDEWRAPPTGSPPVPTNDRHHDNVSEGTEQIPVEASTILVLVERYFPFLLILMFKGILDHISGITVFLGMVVTFGHANTLIRREVTKQSKRSIPLLLMVMMNLLICIFCLYYIFEADRLYPALVCLSTDVPLSSFQSLLWVVLVTDFVAKFVTVMLKCLMIMLPEEVLLFQKRGKHYMFIESTSQMYRCLLPINPWLMYLFGAYDGTFKIFSLILCLLYVISKSVDLSQRLVAWKLALQKFLQPVHYGTVPSLDELNEQFCPICHDGFTCPTKLSCGHIFCEDCVSNWLDRGERSCPMCRARVVDDTSWRDGTTTQFVQIF